MDVLTPCAATVCCSRALRGAGGQVVINGCGLQMQEVQRDSGHTEDSAMKARVQESPVRPNAVPERPPQAGEPDLHLEDPKTPDRPIVSGVQK